MKVYKAVRRIIVPANLEFARLHKLLQYVFHWKNYHLYDFTIMDDEQGVSVARMVPFQGDLEYDEAAILMEGHILSEFLSKYKRVIYTYDLGDDWEHEIRLVQVIQEYDKESPYLLEASGQAPPEDVGGVGGYVEFLEIMKNPGHPEYESTKECAESQNR